MLPSHRLVKTFLYIHFLFSFRKRVVFRIDDLRHNPRCKCLWPLSFSIITLVVGLCTPACLIVIDQCYTTLLHKPY
jgi:hypothetical protein